MRTYVCVDVWQVGTPFFEKQLKKQGLFKGGLVFIGVSSASIRHSPGMIRTGMA